MADAAANGLGTLDSFSMDLVMRIINGSLGGRDAARLACVSKPLLDAVMDSKWPPWSPEPNILADGTVCEPHSGRYSAVVRPEDGWACVRKVIADAPEGATILMMQGVYVASETMELSRPIYIFGNGATILGEMEMADSPILLCTAARGGLIGLSIEAYRQGTATVEVTAGAFRLQGCIIMAAKYGFGLWVAGPGTCPTIVDCKIRDERGCIFVDGACGTLWQCDVRDGATGVSVLGGGDRSALRIEGNVIDGSKRAVLIDGAVDPSFMLGPGNAIHGGERDIADMRIDNAEGDIMPGEVEVAEGDIIIQGQVELADGDIIPGLVEVADLLA